jgi:hypothetical protein
MHFDVEHSFLLQVKGTKHVSVASYGDDVVARHRELDRYLDGEECDFETMQRNATMTVMGPGVGVYLPSYVPHWVETKAGISISFSIPFFTAYTERAEGVTRINARLRKLHLSPKTLGSSNSSDRAKAAVFRSIQRCAEARPRPSRYGGGRVSQRRSACQRWRVRRLGVWAVQVWQAWWVGSAGGMPWAYLASRRRRSSGQA